MTASRSVSTIVAQAAISWAVRPQPMHKLDSGSRTQTLMQGVETAGTGLIYAAECPMRSPHQAAISPHCCAAPATSPVCPPMARRAKATTAKAPTPLVSAARIAWAIPSATKPSARVMARAEPQAAASALEFERARGSARAIGARRRQKRERRQRGGAGERGDQDQAQAPAPEPAVERGGQRANAQDEREHERKRAIGADAAVAHDLELPRDCRAAAEAVGDVGEPIFVQRPGHGDERRHCESRAKKQRQAEQRGEGKGKSANEADRDAGDRRRPGDAVNIERRARPRFAHAQPSEETQGVSDVADGAQAHRNTRTATAPIAVSPDSTMPHWRTRARAAATSPPRSERIWLSSGDMTKKA